MSSFAYLIVGGGMAADAAIAGIREVDAQGPIGLIGDEAHPPYNRPPLSKGLWKDKPLHSIWRREGNDEAILHLGRRAVGVDLAQKQVVDDRGAVYSFKKLLLATGGRPRRLTEENEQVVHYRTLDDYLRLQRLTEGHQRFAVVGAGFIGAEIAAALASIGKHVVMIFPDAAINGRMFPAELAGFLNDYYRQRGVELLPQHRVLKLEKHPGHVSLTLRGPSGGEANVAAEAVVVGVGIEPDVQLAQAAGLAVDDGIRVDPTLATNHPDVFAAGDVASFYQPALGRYLRVEHEDNANNMGHAAGRAMAGASVEYHHLPFFYSDLFDLGYEAVGDVDCRLAMVADWKEPNRQGVVYYLHEGRVRGVLLWNVWEKVEEARALIAQGGPLKPDDLKGRIAS